MSIITISRQFGAGGKTLGEMVAEKMGYTFIDNEIIQMVAQKGNVSNEWVESMEKEAGGAFLKFITQLVPKRLVDRILDNERGYIDEEIYVDLLHKIINQLAENDHILILGRGSQYILRDNPNAYHFLLVAHRDDRVKFMQDNYNLTPYQAAQSITAEDKRRLNLYRKFGVEDFDNPNLYHLVINRSKVSIEKAVDVICNYVGNRSTKTTSH